MMQDPLPLVQDIVLVGGGHAHALVLRMWGMDPLPGVRLTVVNPNPAAPYTGMLPGLIAGHYRAEEIMIDLVRLARFAGARVILDRAVGIDRAAKRIRLAGGRTLRYDIASVDIGIGSDLPEVPGFAEHAVAAKPLGDYARRWERFVAEAPAAPALVLIGAGVGGVELALASSHRLRAAGRVPRITLLERGDAALPHIGARARARLMQRMAAEGIALKTGVTAAAIGADHVLLTDGTRLASDFTLAVAGARAQGWLAETGLSLQDGFIAVDAHLQSSDPEILAAGDCAHLTHAPRPKAGVFAVREAPVLLHNLRALATGRPLQTYRPQRDYLKLVSLGGQAAVADKFGLRSGGAWLWRLKDRIDREFMAKFDAYPAMARALPEPAVRGLAEAMGAKPICGGCGAKVGAGALGDALRAMPRPLRGDVLAGAGDDAAVLRHGGGVQVITTDHLRAFTADAALMTRIAAIHALGDVWAMGAAPQVALAQVTLPRLSAALQADMLAEVMASAGEVFRAVGADVVGGHTTVGAELTIGFTVTGLAVLPVTKGGARPGDALILTKALGSGVIMAAEMALERLPGGILGEAVAGALAQMGRMQDRAAAVLAPVAHAMTDVTGFGLAGHLLEMLEASGCGASLQMEAVPLLPGAEALAGQGVESSLAPANRAAVAGRMAGGTGARGALLFDPQTAGPLLAAVPGDQAEAVIAALAAAGEAAAVVGVVEEGPAFLRVV
ncbi:selenide, water dikinase SelD [Rhodobacter sp. HX-7-19]|uniref:Selenide, water dikinase SelD n=1 Tax=Paragemmobacter kunshanensis TaxID=2583234 RepID=A0A6M1TQI8_9RHOB|nr:selenide, water dikinase SelD [Rhodobacter kunshanensis]NGQ89286.1 selenide, water dikinase SelD [Rhodobacter kunshanensis]